MNSLVRCILLLVVCLAVVVRLYMYMCEHEKTRRPLALARAPPSASQRAPRARGAGRSHVSVRLCLRHSSRAKFIFRRAKPVFISGHSGQRATSSRCKRRRRDGRRRRRRRRRRRSRRISSRRSSIRDSSIRGASVASDGYCGRLGCGRRLRCRHQAR